MVVLKNLVNGCDFVSSGSWFMTWEYNSDHHIQRNLSTPPNTVDPTVRFCKLEDGEGLWYTFRIGPFTSDGGITFRMPFQVMPFFDEASLPHESVGLQAIYQVFVADDQFVDDNTFIVHHQNLWDYSSGMNWKLSGVTNDMMKDNSAFLVPDFSAVPLLKGDFLRPPTMQPGTRGEHWGVTKPEDCDFCYYQDFGAGHAKPLILGPAGYPFVSDGYFVDQRAPGSPLLTWYHQMAWKLVDSAAPGMKLLSEHQLWNPSNKHATVMSGDQSLFYVFSNEDSFIYYTGWWPHAGTLYVPGTYLHTHYERHYETYLFATTPEALGLGLPPLTLERFCLPRAAKQTPAGNNTRVKMMLAENCPSCFERRVVCEGRGSLTYCKQWHFDEGDPFTSLSFFSSKDPVLKPEVQHITWFMRYFADEDVKPLTWNIYKSTFGDDDPILLDDLTFDSFFAFFFTPVTDADLYKCTPPLLRRGLIMHYVQATHRAATSIGAGSAAALAMAVGVLALVARTQRRAALL